MAIPRELRYGITCGTLSKKTGPGRTLIYMSLHFLLVLTFTVFKDWNLLSVEQRLHQSSSLSKKLGQQMNRTVFRLLPTYIYIYIYICKHINRRGNKSRPLQTCDLAQNVFLFCDTLPVLRYAFKPSWKPGYFYTNCNIKLCSYMATYYA